MENDLCCLDRNRALAGDGFSQLESIGEHALSVSVHLTEGGREGGKGGRVRGRKEGREGERREGEGGSSISSAQ